MIVLRKRKGRNWDEKGRGGAYKDREGAKIERKKKERKGCINRGSASRRVTSRSNRRVDGTLVRTLSREYDHVIGVQSFKMAADTKEGEPLSKEKNKEEKKKKIAAPEFRVWSPTTLLGQALSSLTTVDRTGNGAFC